MLCSQGRHRPGRPPRDGKWLIHTNDQMLTYHLAAACKQLVTVERGWKDIKRVPRLRPPATTASTGSAPRSSRE